MSPYQQNENGEWEEAKPLPFFGTGVDWEVYAPGERESHRYVAEGYIGHRHVAHVEAHRRPMLTLKMAVAGLPYRNTRQDSDR